MKNKLFTALLTVATILVMSSCGSTNLLSSWSDSGMDERTTDKILVFSLLGKQDNKTQKDFEEAMVAQLSKNGINATSAYDLFGPYSLKDKDASYISQKITEAGYTGIMLVTLLDKNNTVSYVPGSTVAVPVPGPCPWWRPFYSCYNYYYGVVTTPGYFTTDTEYLVETRLYNTSDEKDAVYVAQTSTVDPANSQTMASELAATVVKDMKQKGIIAVKSNTK